MILKQYHTWAMEHQHMVNITVQLEDGNHFGLWDKGKAQLVQKMIKINRSLKE